jgi:hypothetical protein
MSKHQSPLRKGERDFPLAASPSPDLSRPQALFVLHGNSVPLQDSSRLE